MKVKFLNLNDLKVSEKDLEVVAENLTDNSDLIAAVVKCQLANRRGFSTAKTESIDEISLTGKKPFNQKGRGAARQGSLKGAQFVGGAKAHGPKPRDYSYDMPKKMMKKALSIVLKDKFVNEKVFVIEGMEKLSIGTNELSKKFVKIGILNPLISCQENVENFSKSVRNIKGVKLLNACALNVYDLMKYDFLLLDKPAYEKVIKEVL
ncbi:MAG TPA: 50S ribosomal protein L4 [Rickettsiales bacterium]|nr:50S ribosomal protein L4 [Rickettsiales bacterium]